MLYRVGKGIMRYTLAGGKQKFTLAGVTFQLITQLRYQFSAILSFQERDLISIRAKICMEFFNSVFKSLSIGLAMGIMVSCDSVESKAASQSEINSVISGPVELKVGEGFVEPLGYYESSPRFSWQLPADSAQQIQTSYQLQVAEDPNFSEPSILWDSAKVVSNDNAWIQYQGPQLSSRQQVYWRVKTWNGQDQSSNWSETQSIELGLLNNNDWRAKWIGHPTQDETDPKQSHFSNVENTYNRPQYLRKNFEVAQTAVKARLYITSKGVFKPYINGQAISDDLMTPGWTPYHKRIETLTYDVTDLVNTGQNTLGASLAKGWYSGRIFHPSPTQRTLPIQLLAQLEVQFADGSTQTIVTDESWQTTQQGPIRAASNYDGEKYDANYEMPGWNTPDFTPQNWQGAYAEPIDSQVQLKPKRHTAPKVTMTIPAVSIVSNKNGAVIYDMGQNMVGVPEITIPAKQGQTIQLRFSEALSMGDFYVKNLRSAKNIDLYTPSKDGMITYQPTFTFHGYRFVEVSGFDSAHEPSLDWIKGKVVHSDFAVYDNFSSSHPKLNKLSDNVSWGLRGNFLDIPTDCPQRDERLGWTGDAQVFVSTSMYKADVYRFWAAWLESVREEQSIDGMIPKFVPFRPFLTDGPAAAWGDAATIVPWQLYQYTGDLNVLAENYNMMQQWLNYTEFHSFDYISNMGTYGDWLQPYSENGRAKGDTHPDLIATAYYAHSVDIAAKTARLLGFERDAEQYERLFIRIKDKFKHYFFDENLNLVSTAIKTIRRDRGQRLKRPKTSEITLIPTQTSYLLPLTFNLFDEQEQQLAVNKLLALLEGSDRHLRTGFLGTPMLHKVLQRFGHSELMYDILLKETYPSWFYSINNGATTTWERWDSYSLQDGYNKANMNSLNHYAYGAVAEWFYTGMLGIKSKVPGFKQFAVSPQFTRKLNNLSGAIPTPQGDIHVSWRIDKNNLSMTLRVPKNAQAELLLPKVEKLVVSSIGESNAELSSNTLLGPGDYQISGVITLTH